MIVFLLAFSAFNVILGFAALRRAMKLVAPEGRARWASKRLYAIAVFAGWSLPIVCVLATGVAWALNDDAQHWAAPTVLAPVGWLLLMGTFFAVVDFTEDGVLDFGHGPKPKTPDGKTGG